MAAIELYSRRQKRLRGEINDVYQYKEFTKKFRTQVIFILKSTVGTGVDYTNVLEFYEYVYDTICRENGIFRLSNSYQEYEKEESLFDFFLNTNNYENCLDIIELCFGLINFVVRSDQKTFNYSGSTQDPDNAIEELNTRFRENGLGYQFESNEIIRVDSQILHAEVVKPVLQILGSKEEYKGVNDEFLSAHEHYRNQHYKECLVDCLKSFESVMKVIHDMHSWTYNSSDQAKRLIDSCFSNKLIPDYLQSQFTSLKSLLESGIPTIRNKEGGHGQGSDIKEVPEHLASYTLHLTATNLLFLIKCHENYK